MKKVLTNEVYLGHMVQGRKRSGFTEGRRPYQVPESEWMIVRNTHEPLIDEETFRTVQQMAAEAIENPWLTTCGQFRANTELTEDMAHALIGRVEVDAENRISITLRYQDEYRSLLRLLEAEGEVVPA